MKDKWYNYVNSQWDFNIKNILFKVFKAKLKEETKQKTNNLAKATKILYAGGML